jgi:two-component system, OmpR family, KDP operon response regulator KdpE
MVRNKGILLTHKQLRIEVWGEGHQNSTHYLCIYISQLREKLAGASRGLNDAIISEAGIGYRIDALPHHKTAIPAY